MCDGNPYYYAYEKRYRVAYGAGANYWGHTPDDGELAGVLAEWVSRHQLKGKSIIEFACGEGAAGAILSELGCVYRGVDISPAAVEKAAGTLAGYPTATVTRLDMVAQKINGCYDAALDVMGFHMLVTDPDRAGYLKNAFSCLRNGAPMLFFRECHAEDAYGGYIATFDDWLSVTGNDYTTPRQLYFQKDGKDVEIHIPYVPARARSKEGYLREISAAEFTVDSLVELDPSRQNLMAVSIYARKP